MKTFFRNCVLSLSGILILLSSMTYAKAPEIHMGRSWVSDSITVYIFLLETCPISQSITIEMKKTYAKYESKGITFVGLFPNKDLSNGASIKKFGKKYNLPFELRMDENQRLVQQFSATTTPEVIVVRNTDSKILYRGRIDNSFEGIGRRRQVVTEHYLNSALENILLNQPINPTETKPVGCFISK
ncbi:MAG: redoxin domain-containing protein [Bacteroidota bacterium]